jgi:phage terminase small subunit
MAEESNKALTPKQKRFCEEYLIDLNGTQAAIRAGYSKDSAKEIASENLTKLNIKTEIERLQRVRSEKLEISANEVLQKIRDIAFSDITKTMTVTIAEFEDLPESVRLCISKFKTFTRSYDVGEETISETTVELWFWDKMKAFDMLNKHIGFYEADNDQQNNVTIFQLPDNGRETTPG